MTQRALAASSTLPIAPSIEQQSLRIRAIKIPLVEHKTCLKRGAIYERLNPNSGRFDETFPRPFRYPRSRSVYWIEAEVEQWVQTQIERSRRER